MAITTTSNITAPVNVVFQMEFLRRAKALCPYLYGTQPASIAEHSGTFTAKWRRFGNLTPTTVPLAELSGTPAFPTRSGSQPSITDITATVQKYGDFFYLNEEVDLINYSGQGEELSGVLGTQAGRSLNRLQRDIAEDNFTALLSGVATTATNISGAASASGFIKRGDIQNVVNILDREDALKFKPMTTGSQNIGTSPIRNAYVGITHPDIIAHLRSLTGFSESQTYAGQTELWPEEAGYMDGVRFIETTEAGIDLTSGVAATGSATTFGRSTATRFDIYNTVIYGKDALGSLGLGEQHTTDVYKAGDKMPAIQMISKPKGSAGAADALNELSSVGWKLWHGGTVLNSAWGRNLRSSAPILDSNE